VIDTISLKAAPDHIAIPTTERMHFSERVQVYDHGKAMQDDVWVDDPNAYTDNWRGLVIFRQRDDDHLEWACGDNTFSY
jgi:hypothetical protein